MQDNRNLIVRLRWIILTILSTGCAATVAPDGWLPSTKELQTDSYGGWLVISSKPDKRGLPIEGEFIGIQHEQVYILPLEGGARMISMDSIASARLQIHRKQHGRIAGWTGLGVISTLSHGFYLIISAPVWLLSGIISAVSVSKEGDFEATAPSRGWWNEMAKFSRFPQGVPEDLDTKLLLGKPAPED
jgi:hypothetical protein